MMLTTGELKQAAEYAKRSLKYETFASKRFSTYTTYDLFISHSFKDKDLVVGLYYMFDRAGYNVYIDWIDDASLNRENVTDQTAAIIRQRIRQSKGLSYIATANITSSKWCPWELGVSDGMHGRACILPVLYGTFKGQEYLGLYPYLEYKDSSEVLRADFYIHSHRDSSRYISLRNWLNGQSV